jgi:hypothetical protein
VAQGTRTFGTQSLHGTVTIQAGVNDSMTIDFNGFQFSITIPAGSYMSSYNTCESTLIPAINSALVSVSAPFKAILGGIVDGKGKVVLAFEGNDHTALEPVNAVTGSAVATVWGSVYNTSPPIS